MLRREISTDSMGMPATADHGPFSGFGAGWTLSNLPYLSVFKNIEGQTLKDASNEWADDRVVMVTNGGDARLFVPFGDKFAGQEEGWQALSLDDRSDVRQEFGELVRDSAGDFTYTTPDGIVYRFDAEGRLTQIEPLTGSAMRFEYDATTGQITEIGYSARSRSGDVSTFTPDANLGETTFNYTNGWLSGIAQPGGRNWTVDIVDGELQGISLDNLSQSFTYNDDHQLLAVTRGSNDVGNHAVQTMLAYDNNALLSSVTVGTPGNETVYTIETLASRRFHEGTTDEFLVEDSDLEDSDLVAEVTTDLNGLQNLPSNDNLNLVAGDIANRYTFDTLGRLLKNGI